MGTDRMLGGRYELWEILGEGGMGTVHLGRDRHLERWVAVKVLHADLVGDPVSRSRFRREAQTIARLDHPGIVTVHDVGWHYAEGTPDAPGSPFIVMEYVTGQTLHARLREGAIAVEEAIRYQLGLLSALEFSHHAGVVHRDIKPANVLVTRGGGVKVVDFGIARVGGDIGATAPQTHALVGTAQYLSPEQVRAEITDARSDLYSAGCLLYELLTGRPPFPGDDPIAIAYQHLHQAPRRAGTFCAEITPALDDVLLTALAKDRDDRFQSARSFIEALRSVARDLHPVDDRVAPDPPVAVCPSPGTARRRHPTPPPCPRVSAPR
jgi:serine/threonine-protein kinase